MFRMKSCLCLAVVVVAAAGCSQDEAATSSTAGTKGRVVILGFDGVEPSIVSKMMDDGELPNLAALRDSGTFTPLASSNPPQSPTAWSSFTTSLHPGDHGVYDFLRRTPSKYLPGVGFGRPVSAVLAADGSVSQPPRFQNVRKGKSFWKIANEQGAKVKILSVPFSFPAEDLEDSCMLSGLGVPDVRGTTSWYFYFGEDVKEKTSVSGGDRLPLDFTDGSATVMLDGMRNPQTRDFVRVPVTLTPDRAAKTVEFVFPGTSVTLKEGTWSKWLEWELEVTPKYTVHAISRVHVLEAGDTVRLYMSCLQFHPDHPYICFTTPENYASDLKERYGFYKTIGWIYDTHALRKDALTDDVFLDDVRKTMAWRTMLTLDELDRGNFDLLVSAWTGTDRVSHLFWRFRDPKHPLYTVEGAAKYGEAVEDTYREMDKIVGKVVAKLAPEDLLMILSDHGFHSFRRGFNVNTWLIRNGYLWAQGQTDAATGVNNKPYLQGYDWRKSKAYNLGLGSIFLNQQGREGQGIVRPVEAGDLIEEIRAKLLEVTDPESGEKVFSAIYTRDDFKGGAQADAPDLQLGYAEGFQSTKNAAKGAAPAELFEDNKDKWSGDHAASDMAITPGIFFSNKPIALDDPHLVDLGVTALDYLGRDVPDNLEGRPLL